MEKIEFTTQKDVISYMDDLLDKCKNNTVRNILAKEYGVGKEFNNPAKVSLMCKVVSEVLKKNGAEEYSEITVWRYIKIKDQSQDLCNQVRTGQLKIKQAFEMLNSSAKKEKKENPSSTSSIGAINNASDFDDLVSVINKYKDEVLLRKEKLSEKQIKEIDSCLFKIRKALGNELASRTLDDEYI